MDEEYESKHCSTAFCGSAFIDPQIIARFREENINTSISNLADKVDDKNFILAFGTTKDNIQELIDTRAVSVGRLLETLPAELAQEPTPIVYNEAMYAFAVLNVAAVVTNHTLKPVKS